MRVVLIDDEQANHTVLEKMLALCDGVEVIGAASTVLQAGKMVRNANPDLIFLDIEMGEASGFDFLQLFPDREFQVVFVTAYEQYAIKAIKEAALDYLLKPIDPDELIEVVDKAKSRLNGGSGNSSGKLVVNTTEQTHFITVESIIRIEGDGNYSTIYTEDSKPVVVSRNLKSVEQELAGHPFFRAHKSHLVNLDHVNSLSKIDGFTIIMSDGSEVPLARRSKEAFMDLVS